MNTMNITPMVEEWHFLVINENRCVRGQKLRSLMAAFDNDGLSYCVWLVPCSQSDPYHINHECPQVKGSFVLEYVDFEVDEVA
jgi:hypothetical protein